MDATPPLLTTDAACARALTHGHPSQLKLADGTHYELHVPHCLAETSASGEALSKADVIVVTAPHQVHSMWSYVDPADFDLVPPEKDTLPGVVVRSASPGIYAVYSRGDVPVQQRVLCLAFVPFKVNPLDTEVMRLRIVPDLPTAVQGAFHAERVARGLVVAAGCSPVFTVKHRHNRATTQLRVQVSDSRDGRLLMREDIWWDGEYDQIDCLFEPNEWFIDGITKATAKFDVQMTAAQLTEGVRLTQPNHLAVEPIKFDAKILVHLFPAPSPPKSVRVVHRTSTNLKVEYEPPEDWGGCALTEYQLELREKTHKGDWTEWNLVATANGWERAVSTRATNAWGAREEGIVHASRRATTAKTHRAVLALRCPHPPSLLSLLPAPHARVALCPPTLAPPPVADLSFQGHLRVRAPSARQELWRALPQPVVRRGGAGHRGGGE